MKNNLRSNLKYFIRLSKLKVMVPVSLTGFTGYFIYDPNLTLKIFLITTGILLLAISASVLNQIHEAEIDGRMERTRDRPIPSGKIKKIHAAIFCIVVFLTGCSIVYLAGNVTSLIIGLLTILWYNGVYTYSKRVTAFSVVPGAITGALPPLIGWVAAGGGVWERPILFVEFLFFIGQVPHFWLLIMRYGEQYESAQLPSLTRVLSRPRIRRLTFAWVVTSVIAALFLWHFGIIQSTPVISILVMVSVLMIWQFKGLLKKSFDENKIIKYSVILNIYFLIVIMLLISDRIIR